MGAPLGATPTAEEPTRHLRVVNQLALALLEPTALEEILWIIVRTAIANLGFEDCVIYLRDDRHPVMIQKAAYGPKNPIAEEILSPITIPVGQGIVGSVAQRGASELIPDTRLDPRYILDDDMRLSELAVPILHEGEVIGVIDSEHPDAGFYTEAHREILTTIASMASTKIASAMTIERLNETVRRLKNTEDALRRGEQRYRLLYDHHPSMFFTLAPDDTVLSANTFAADQLQYPIEELVGLSLADLSPAEEASTLESALARCRSRPAELHRWESCRITRTGAKIWVRETARVVDLGEHEGSTILVVSEDVTDTHKLATELRYQASHDALTGLFNRREFELRTSRAIEDARTEGSEHAVCYLDLDQFKNINDTSGHVAGDELLRQMSVSLKERLRKSDVIARLGGDEFGVLIQHCSLEQAEHIARSLLDVANKSRFEWNGRVFRLGVSIGMVSINATSGTLSDVLVAADTACYAAKERGRNRLHTYSPDDQDRVRREGEVRWATRINEALEDDRFELLQQPIRALSATEIEPDSVEIFLHMLGDDGERIPPGSFLPAAERHGYGIALDRWVVRHTLDWLAQHRAVLDRFSSFAINLTTNSVGDDEFATFLARELSRTSVAAHKVCLEIKELAAIAQMGRARACIEAVKALGCRSALDNFGSGLSSVAYLRNLPVDLLKVDGAFVKDLKDHPIDRQIVRSISEVASMLGKRTVAEQVESEDMLDTLRDIGIDYAQGFVVGAPRPLAALADAPQTIS
jgi:diguanylate cyclase (GGDEF)-like protein/PAS domain S-box-containing protein